MQSLESILSIIITSGVTLFAVYLGHRFLVSSERDKRYYKLREEAYSQFLGSIYKLYYGIGDYSTNQAAQLESFANIQLYGGTKVTSKLNAIILEEAERTGSKDINYEIFCTRVIKELIPVMRSDFKRDIPEMTSPRPETPGPDHHWDGGQ